MTFDVSKTAGTYSDDLQAIGLAALIQEMTGAAARIRDDGANYSVHSPADPAAWQVPTPGYPYIWDSKLKNGPPKPHGPVLDYRAAVESRDLYRQFLKSARAAAARTEIETQGLTAPPKPPDELAIATILGSMRKGWFGDLDLHRWLSENPLRALAWARANLLAAEPITAPPWSNTQFLNPISGKGVHAPKTRARAAAAVADELLDPFKDWLKLRGAFHSMLPYREGEDFKLFVLRPADITEEQLHTLAVELRGMNLWGGLRLDIQAVLRCTELVVRHSDVMADGGKIRLLRSRPRRVISGLRLAYFKNLGTAAALMGEAVLQLPDWFDINNRDDAEAVLQLIGDILGQPGGAAGCLATLDPDHSEDVAALQIFRDWVSSGALEDLLEFHARFAVHIVGRKSRGQWARTFTTRHLNLLLEKAYHMDEIIKNEGFLSIARAIRNKTIYTKRFGGLKNLEPAFGLAQNWKQKIRAGDDEFLAAVAEFVQSYNWEVKQKNEPGHRVRTEDLDQFVALVRAKHAETPGMLLLAYGYAVAPAVGADKEDAAQEGDAQ